MPWICLKFTARAYTNPHSWSSMTQSCGDRVSYSSYVGHGDSMYGCSSVKEQFYLSVKHCGQTIWRHYVGWYTRHTPYSTALFYSCASCYTKRNLQVTAAFTCHPPWPWRWASQALTYWAATELEGNVNVYSATGVISHMYLWGLKVSETFYWKWGKEDLKYK